ncbi:MAG TPA: GntR family transcriptional regulator [Vicinamibacterales bacterium]
MHSELQISQADPRPMYQQIVEQIRHRIAVGDWPPGYELPSIRALAASARVSVITVKRAYFDLEREGVIVTRQGKGSFVADRAELSTQLRLAELDAHLTAAVNVGRVLGLPDEAMVARLREVLARKDQKEP